MTSRMLDSADAPPDQPPFRAQPSAATAAPTSERGPADRARVDELEATVERLHQRIEDLQLFALYTAHEIKNPLRALAISAETLLADAARPSGVLSTEELVARLADIGDGAHQLNAQVSDLVSVIVDTERPLATGPVDLASVIDGVLSSFGDDLARIPAEVTVADELPVVTADEAMVRTVFTNLVANAIRHRGQRALRLTISARRGDDGRCLVTVADNGPGIHPDDQRRVFAPLGRVDRSRPGFGLGLALSRRMVERMGGTIALASTPGRGAAFTVRLICH